MANKITIDLDTWTTMAQKAKADGIKLSTLSWWVRRSKLGTDIKGKPLAKPVEYWDIPELGITLVKK